MFWDYFSIYFQSDPKTYATFTLLPRGLFETFEELRRRQGTCECRHSHSCARATRKASITKQNICILWVWPDLPCFRELRDKKRHMYPSLSFLTDLLLPQRECKRGIKLGLPLNVSRTLHVKTMRMFDVVHSYILWHSPRQRIDPVPRLLNESCTSTSKCGSLL